MKQLITSLAVTALAVGCMIVGAIYASWVAYLCGLVLIMTAMDALD